MIVAYVSGHGFGHATRVGEVLRAVRALAPRMPLAVVTSGPEALYRSAVPGPFELRSLECDVGVAQGDALTLDEDETVRRWHAFRALMDGRIAAEAEWLGRIEARVVLGDVPPLAFEAAARAGIPGVGLANFSWDWIYRHLARRRPALLEAAEAAAASYGRAALLLQLPFEGDLAAFPRREPIPLVARRPRLERAEARRRVGADGRPLVLVSFGGLRPPSISSRALARLSAFRFAVSTEPAEPAENVLVVTAERLQSLGLGYPDLVVAADVVVTKPGYGIVSDAIAARTRLVYTERGDFPEYDVLVRSMPRFLPCAHVGNEDLRAGDLEEALRDVLVQPFPEAPDLGGAAAAAERLLDLAGGNGYHLRSD